MKHLEETARQIAGLCKEYCEFCLHPDESERVKGNLAQVRLMFSELCGLESIYVMALASHRATFASWRPELIARCLFDDVDQFEENRLLIVKLIASGNVSRAINWLHSCKGKLHACAVVSMAEDLQPGTGAAIAAECLAIYDNAEAINDV